MPIKLVTPTKTSILATMPPPSTRTYKSVSHGQIIDLLSEELDKQGFRIVNEVYNSNLGNKVVNGHLKLDVGMDSELSFEIAFLNSYDKTKRAVIVAGSEVRVCFNGHILGDDTYGSLKKKHVGQVSDEINKFIPEMIKSANETFDLLVKQKKRMKEIELDKKIRNQLIGQLYLDEAIITDTQMSIIKKQIDNPSFDYGTNNNTLWDAYNAVTLALKNSHPTRWITDHQTLNKVVNEEYAL